MSLFQRETKAFRLALIQHYIAATGSKPAAARALGLQRTYLQRLLRGKGAWR